MSGHIQTATLARRTAFGRGFAMLAAAWLVAQARHGVFLGPWADDASLPGNACWLLILFCQLRLALDWLASGWRERRAPPELLFQALSVVTLEIALRAASAPFSGPLFGQLLFFAQPVIVLFGFAALHRRQPQRA